MSFLCPILQITTCPSLPLLLTMQGHQLHPTQRMWTLQSPDWQMELQIGPDNKSSIVQRRACSGEVWGSEIDMTRKNCICQGPLQSHKAQLDQLCPIPCLPTQFQTSAHSTGAYWMRPTLPILRIWFDRLTQVSAKYTYYQYSKP